MYPIIIQLSSATAAQRRVPIWLVDATDGITAETGVTGTPQISKNGGAAAACTNSITQVDATNFPGLYYIELTATEVNTLGTVYLSFKTAATARWHGVAHVMAFNPYDVVRMGLTALPNAAAEAAGGLYTRGTSAGQINQDASGRIDVNLVATGTAVITATSIAANAIGASELAADAVTEIRDAILADSTPFNGADIAAILVDTTEIGVAGAGLTNINLPNQTMDIVGNITGNLSGSVGSVTAGVTLGTGAVTATAIAASGANKVADHTIRRTLANVRSSSDGDTVDKRSLLGAGAKLVNRINTTTVPGSLTVFEEDDTTSFFTQVLTTNASADPITEADTV